VGDFPPNSNMQGIRFSAAALATIFPFSGDPVNTITSNGFLVISVATLNPPSITL